MAGNICGNCANFKPKAGEKFFNCTDAKQGGIKYGMQVRSDTRACEAFTVPAKSTTPKLTPTAEPGRKPVVKSAPQVTPRAEPGAARQPSATPPEDKPRPTGLCAWGKTVLIVSVVIVVALVSWGVYACGSSSGSTPGGGKPTPTVTITPTHTLQYFSMGQWAETSIQRRAVVSKTIVSSYQTEFGPYAPPIQAPPGIVFVIVEASTIYTGGSSLTTAPGDFVLTDAEGHRYRYNVYQSNGPYPSTTLSVAGITTTGGKILYTVPSGTSGLEVSCLLQGDQPVLAVWKLQ